MPGAEPQFYPECAHLEVSNDEKEGSIPSGEYMVKIPGVWSMDRTYANGRVDSMRLMIVEPEINIDIYNPEVSAKTVRSIETRVCLKGSVLTTIPRYTTSRAHLYGLESRRSTCRTRDGLSMPWNHGPVNRAFAHHNSVILCGAIG